MIKRQGLIYIIATVLCILFSIIYESFSHGVISNFMIFSFLIPLLLGVVSTYLIYFFKKEKLPTALENNFYNAGVATLTFGSIIEGVLEIYGTTNIKVYAYLVIGVSLIIISNLLYIVSNKKFL